MNNYIIDTIQKRNKITGLAFWIATACKISDTITKNGYFGLGSKEDNENLRLELKSVKDTIKALFNDLDNLCVPFWVQNLIIEFAKNKALYNSIDIIDYLQKLDCCNINSLVGCC